MDEDTRTQQEINKYKKFKKVDGATYRKVNGFLRKRTYITAREWALARLCTDFRTSGGAEMTFIGKNLPELVPFMEDTYSPQAVNQARNSFKKKVRKSSATFFYGAMCGFFTTDELDDLLFEASEVARFLLEVEGTTLDIDEEIDIEDRITQVMRGVGEAAKTILKARGEEVERAADLSKGSEVSAGMPGAETISQTVDNVEETRDRVMNNQDCQANSSETVIEKSPPTDQPSPVPDPEKNSSMHPDPEVSDKPSALLQYTQENAGSPTTPDDNLKGSNALKETPLLPISDNNQSSEVDPS